MDMLKRIKGAIANRKINAASREFARVLDHAEASMKTAMHDLRHGKTPEARKSAAKRVAEFKAMICEAEERFAAKVMA